MRKLWSFECAILTTSYTPLIKARLYSSNSSRWLNTQPLKLEQWGWLQLVGLVYSQLEGGDGCTPGRAMCAMWELHSGIEWTSRGCGQQALQWQEAEVILAPMGGCDWLVWMILPTGREVKPISCGLRVHFFPLIEKLAEQEPFPPGGGIHLVKTEELTAKLFIDIKAHMEFQLLKFMTLINSIPLSYSVSNQLKNKAKW